MGKSKRKNLLSVILLICTAVFLFTVSVYASDDNSLADLGITTEGVTVSPDFEYDIWEYSVVVPAGTTVLELSPRTTNSSAVINSVTGTELNDDGTGTVVISVTSESGNTIEYVLNVTSARESEDPAEAIAANESSSTVTIDTEVVQSEVETEDPRYVKVDRNSLEDAKETIERLQAEITRQRQQIRMLTYVLYGLIAVSIIFLFILISILLRRRDMAQELREYRASDPYRKKQKGDKKDKNRRREDNKKSSDDEWDDWDEDGYESSGSSWADPQVGTPVVPKKVHERRDEAVSTHGDMTKMYKGERDVRAREVPKDVTRDLSRVNKAEAKALKKAAAAQAKEKREAEKAAAAKQAEAKRETEKAVAAKQAEAKRQAEKAAAAKQAEAKREAEKAAAAKRTEAKREAEKAAAAKQAEAKREAEKAAAAKQAEAKRPAEEAGRTAGKKAETQKTDGEAVMKTGEEEGLWSGNQPAHLSRHKRTSGKANAQGTEISDTKEPGQGGVEINMIDL